MVLNNPPKPPGDLAGEPCYRCVFPKPPPADSVVSCADGGIIGPVVGTMGVLQALETIKVLTKTTSQDTNTASNQPLAAVDRPFLHIFSAFSTPPFRTIRLRGRRTDCAVCSSQATVTLETLQSGSTDYVQFCGSLSTSQVLTSDERILVRDFKPIYTSKKPYTLVDVRDPVQFGICNLESSINIPINKILHGKVAKDVNSMEQSQSLLPSEIASADSTDPIYFICRLGNDSQLAVRKLKELGLDQDGKRYIGDVSGGFKAWKAEVDPEWPEY
jgi:adenylyltransferase and sulfurtransferase